MNLLPCMATPYASCLALLYLHGLSTLAQLGEYSDVDSADLIPSAVGPQWVRSSFDNSFS